MHLEDIGLRPNIGVTRTLQGAPGIVKFVANPERLVHSPHQSLVSLFSSDSDEDAAHFQGWLAELHVRARPARDLRAP